MTMEPETQNANLKDATTSKQFAIAYLQLCQISYLLPVSVIAPEITKLPALHQGGSWQCLWGPVQSADEANLVYVAAYFDSTGLPVFTAVVIRGTDLSVTDPLGILEQIWEDADVLGWSPLPWDPSQPARIANGSIDTLSTIQGLQHGGQTLEAFLASYLGDPRNGNPVLVVTGHSLGGGLVSVVAPWLKSALAADGLTPQIFPSSFAAPTAGNGAFADYYDAQFPSAARYWNTLDVVPRGWWDLSGISTIYEGCGLIIPDTAYALILAWEFLLWAEQRSYIQPHTNSVPLWSSCMNSNSDWYVELAYQHHTTTYMSILGGTSIVMPPSFVPTGRSRRQSKLYKRFGTLSTCLRR